MFDEVVFRGLETPTNIQNALNKIKKKVLKISKKLTIQNIKNYTHMKQRHCHLYNMFVL